MAADTCRLVYTGPIDVHLCCNDPDNGNFTGRIEAIEIGPNLSLYAATHAPRLVYLDRKIRISGQTFEIVSHKEWYGNWCWDFVRMPGADVIRLMNFLNPKGWLSVDEAEERLYNLWSAGFTWSWGWLPLIADRGAPQC
ncbi:MAG: hypothetical protein AAF402_17365 [Pseudomonadota bacterium]